MTQDDTNETEPTSGFDPLSTTVSPRSRRPRVIARTASGEDTGPVGFCDWGCNIVMRRARCRTDAVRGCISHRRRFPVSTASVCVVAFIPNSAVFTVERGSTAGMRAGDTSTEPALRAEQCTIQTPPL